MRNRGRLQNTQNGIVKQLKILEKKRKFVTDGAKNDKDAGLLRVADFTPCEVWTEACPSDWDTIIGTNNNQVKGYFFDTKLFL